MARQKLLDGVEPLLCPREEAIMKFAELYDITDEGDRDSLMNIILSLKYFFSLPHDVINHNTLHLTVIQKPKKLPENTSE